MNKDAEDRVGLCARCVHVEIITSTKGSTFYLCQLSQTDARFAKYPRLPVISCTGFHKEDAAKPA